MKKLDEMRESCQKERKEKQIENDKQTDRVTETEGEREERQIQQIEKRKKGKQVDRKRNILKD